MPRLKRHNLTQTSLKVTPAASMCESSYCLLITEFIQDSFHRTCHVFMYDQAQITTHTHVHTHSSHPAHSLLCFFASPADLPACTPTDPLSLQIPQDITLNSFQETFSSLKIK